MSEKTKNELSFEEAVKRLEEIVGGLESQSVDLDRSIELFEEGVGLVRKCTKMLDEAEQKVKILTRSEDGEIVEADFIPTEN